MVTVTMSDIGAHPQVGEGGSWLVRLMDRFLMRSGRTDESGYYVQNEGWPPQNIDSDLTNTLIREKLDEAFSGYYDAAMQSLARVPSPATGRLIMPSDPNPDSFF